MASRAAENFFKMFAYRIFDNLNQGDMFVGQTVVVHTFIAKESIY